MPTVVDELIVTLGLDPTDFNKKQREQAQALLNTKNTVQAAGREVESAARKSGAFLQQLQGRFLTLMAVFAGGKGLKQFFSDIVSGDAALGRMAVIAGTTATTLSKWQGIASATGGSAAGVTGSINSLNQALVNLSLTGESSVIPYLRALQAFAPGVNLSLIGANGQMRTAVDMLPDLHKAVQGMEEARATAILSGMGLGQDLINILIQSDAQFNKFMQDQQRWGAVTKEQAKAAQELQYNASGVSQSFQTLGRMILQSASPALNLLLKKLQDVFVWFQNNPEKLKQTVIAITAAVGGLALAFGGPIVWVSALAAAVALLYDDWKTWNDGGKAQFGEFWQYVDDKWKAIAAVAYKAWNDIKGTAVPIFEALKKYIFSVYEVWRDANALIWALFTGTSEDVRKAFGNLLGSLFKSWDAFWNGLARAVYDAAPAIFDAMKRAFGFAFDWIIGRANTIWKAVTGKDLFVKDEKGNWSQTDANPNEPGASAQAGGNMIPVPADRRQIESDIQTLMKLGWTREQATGMVANIVAESSGDQKAVGDGGKAYGLAQWHPDRQENFKKVFGKDIRQSTREEQLQFMDWELRNTERAAGNILRNSKTAGEAAQIVSTHYERPKYIGLEAAKRHKLATDLYNSPTPAPSPVPPGATGAAVTGPLAHFGQPGGSYQSEVNINSLVVNTQATDASGIAQDMRKALELNSLVANSNYGPT